MRSHLALLLLAAAPMTACKPNGFDRGCIRVDDARAGYANLADALTVAESGSTLTLCERVILDTVIIDKAVTLVGDPNDPTAWVPPENEPAAVIRDGGSLTVSDVVIQTLATSFIVDAGGALDLSGVEFVGPSGWAVDATDAQVGARDIIVELAGRGGFRLTGPTATLDLSDFRFERNVGFGVLLEGAASATIANGRFQETFVSDANATEWDGFAVALRDQASATVTDVEMIDNVLGAFFAEGSSTLDVTGLDAQTNYFGVWAESSAITLRDGAIVNSDQYDILAVGGSEIILEGVDLIADPQRSPAQGTGNSLDGHYGVLMQAGLSLSITDSTISGHNGGGVYAVGAVSRAMPATITNTTIDDNQGQGVLFQFVEATFRDVTISGTRNNDATCITAEGFLNCNWGLGAFSTSLDWDGGALNGNDYVGVLIVEGSLTLSELALADNEEGSVWAESAAVSLADAEVTGWGAYGVLAFDTVLQLDRVAFSDRAWDWEVTSGTQRYLFADSAIDIEAQGGTVTLRDVVFDGGDFGLELFSTDTTLTDVQFSGYADAAIGQYAGSTTLLRVDFADSGPNALRCASSGALTGSDLTFTDIRRTSTLTEVYEGATLVSSFPGSRTGPAISVNGCATDLARVTIDGTDDRAVVATNADVELTALTVSDVAQHASAANVPAVELRYTTRDPLAFLADVSITGVGAGDALGLYGANTRTTAQVSLNRITLGGPDEAGIAGRGLVLDRLGCADALDCQVIATNLDISGTGGDGVNGRGTWATLGGTIDGAGGQGVSWASTLDPGVAEDPLDDVLRPGALHASALQISSPVQSGVSLTGGTHTITGLTVAQAGAFGMACAEDPEEDVPAFDVCTYAALDGASGALSGCGACVAAE